MFNRHMIMAPEGEISSGGSAVNEQIMDNVDPNETFDNLEYESDSSKKAGQAFAEKFKDRIEKAKKAKEELEKDSDDKPKSKKGSDIDLVKNEDEEMDLDEKPVKEKAEKSKEAKKEDKPEKSDKEKNEEGDEKDIPKDNKADQAKKLKIRMSDGLYGIESDAKVRVKIDGDYQEVPVQELINQYSGKVAYDKKFTEIGNEKKQLEFEKSEFQKNQTALKSLVDEVVSKFDDKNSNPQDAMMILVEKSGRDPFELWKRTIESNLDEVEKLMSMSEVERENYFLKKKDEFRSKADKARTERYQKEQALNQALSKLDAIRQARGVSEEQYLAMLDELEAQGTDTNKLSDEEVVERASLKPHVTTVQDVLEPFEEQIDDSKYPEIVHSLARQLRKGDFTKEQLQEKARKEFALDDDLKDLQMRTKEPQKKVSRETVKDPEKIETLDWD